MDQRPQSPSTARDLGKECNRQGLPLFLGQKHDVFEPHGVFNRIQKYLVIFLLAISFCRVPATTVHLSPPQSWEAVLAYAASCHLQWGKEIIFTYGPLGFLNSDYYWGYLFWPSILWAFGFAMIAVAVFFRLSKRIPLGFRIVLLLVLPFAAAPLNFHLGFDPVYFLAIAALSISAFPEERPSLRWLLLVGMTLGILCQIKFTFFIYSALSIFFVSLAQLQQRKWREFAFLFGSIFFTFLGTWLAMGQNISHLVEYFHMSFKVAGGYTSALSLSTEPLVFTFGLATGFLLLLTIFFYWLASTKSLTRFLRICIVGMGAFLAWKEGFVRSDQHIYVFFVYAFLLFTLMPAFALTSTEKLPRYASLFSIAGLLISGTFFLSPQSQYISAAGQSLFPKFSDSFSAFFSPLWYRSALERQLEQFRRNASIPTIRATVGGSSVGVLNYDQDVAILNQLNYMPHPVFQSYSAYTPELQYLNLQFFSTDKAPEYILWKYGTIDHRFPTLDEGKLILEITRSYDLVLREGSFLLWKRNPTVEKAINLQNAQVLNGRLDQKINIPDGPSWLKVEIKQTLLGLMRSFAFKPPTVFIDVQLKDGETLRHRLIPGTAASGFLVNPLVQTDTDLVEYANHQLSNKSVTALGIHTDNDHFYKRDILFSIQGITSTGTR
jgi:hypothetical protein